MSARTTRFFPYAANLAFDTRAKRRRSLGDMPRATLPTELKLGVPILSTIEPFEPLETSESLDTLESSNHSEPTDATDFLPDTPSDSPSATTESEIDFNDESIAQEVIEEPEPTIDLAMLDDDTSMLKEFLGRVKAEKAAKMSSVTEADVDAVLTPPRDTRSALTELDTNSPSPRTGKQPGGPSEGDESKENKVGVGAALANDALCKEQDEAVTFRRSKRIRLPSLSKAAPALDAPSFIPVRRPDGAEPVRLQQSAAQALAVLTRVNTRRNKGQPCAMVLHAAQHDLAAGNDDMPARRSPGRGAPARKSVTWDEKLAYFQDDDAKATKKKRGKGRRASVASGARRRQGNGTPASKRVLVHDV